MPYRSMRLQPAAWASSTSASRRGYSAPFSARYFAVQFSMAPSVQASVVVVSTMSPACQKPGFLEKPGFSELSLAAEPLFAVEVLEGLHDVVQMAGDDTVQLVQRQVDAVVGDAVLREVVRADALGAIAGADQGAALLGTFFVQRLLPALIQPAAQDAHRPLEILVLAALVLALDFHLFGSSALVPDADGGFRLVDVLPAGAARPHALPLDVLILHLDLHFVGLGQNRHRGGRRVNAPLLLGLGHALHAMSAALETHVLIDAVAR